MSQYSKFFLNSRSNVIELETLEISHPSFSKTYFIVRNSIAGLTATLEDGRVITFDYYPVRITPMAASDDLDQAIKIEFGDLGQILPTELDRINVAGTFGTKPVVKYRTFRSDDLSQPMNGPVLFEISDMPFSKDGVAFEAGAPKVNYNTTGEVYTNDRFPMLRGFL
jgi:hypothetical protein